MNKIEKIFGAIAVTGIATVSGRILYNRGYENGYKQALRDDDEYNDCDDFNDDEAAENGIYYSDDFREGLGFSYSEFLDAMNVIRESHRASAWLLKERLNISYDKARALIQHFMDIGYIGTIRQAPHNSFEVYIDEERDI